MLPSINMSELSVVFWVYIMTWHELVCVLIKKRFSTIAKDRSNLRRYRDGSCLISSAHFPCWSKSYIHSLIDGLAVSVLLCPITLISKCWLKCLSGYTIFPSFRVYRALYIFLKLDALMVKLIRSNESCFWSLCNSGISSYLVS